MDVHEFISKWGPYQGNEKQGASAQFQDICALVKHETPAKADPKAEWFTTEMGVEKAGGGHGWADAWKKGFFAWEYKSPGEDLKKAYQQLQQYRENLENPPLLVVSDM